MFVDAMVGDVNIFFTDPSDHSLAEIEIMIAETHFRGKGYGYEACLLMMLYGKFQSKTRQEMNRCLCL